MFCAQTMPQLPMNDKGPHTNPAAPSHGTTQKNKWAVIGPFFSRPLTYLHITSCSLVDQLKIDIYS